jgi:hypothetical protein
MYGLIGKMKVAAPANRSVQAATCIPRRLSTRGACIQC